MLTFSKSSSPEGRSAFRSPSVRIRRRHFDYFGGVRSGRFVGSRCLGGHKFADTLQRSRGYALAGPQPADKFAVVDRHAAERRFRNGPRAAVLFDLVDQGLVIFHTPYVRPTGRAGSIKIPIRVRAENMG